MAPREQGYASAVIYLAEANGTPLNGIARALDDAFEHFEIVVAYDGPSNRLTPDSLCGLCCDAVSIVYMGRPQGLEPAMCAGVDAAVGDWVFEIDDPLAFDVNFIAQALDACREGYDIVCGASPRRTGRGQFFYPLFNRFSKAPYKLTSGSCRLVSRRAINRVKMTGGAVVYRKAAYAASGLGVISVPTTPVASQSYDTGLGLAVDALAIYTDAFYKMAFGFSALMAVLSFVEIGYVIAWRLFGETVDGWTTTVFAITLGFFGVFCILTAILKYLSLLLRFRFRAEEYLIEGVEKTGGIE